MIIDTLTNGMTVWIKKEHERNGIYVTLGTHHPECDKCNAASDENCMWCIPGKELVLKPSYIVTVQYDDNSQTKDEFDSFYDAFDSFTNIVKTLTKEI
jgi:hypothetical protein